MTISDFAIVIATLLGPILAVQAQKWIEAIREGKNRRITIFRSLMATRAASLSPVHVEALNAIPIEFYGRKKQFKEVVQAWRELLDHLSNDQMEAHLWGQKRQEFFMELLWKLAAANGYSFTKLELQKEVYSPRGHAVLEGDQDIIRRGLVGLFKGEQALPLDINSFPVDVDFVEQQRRTNALLEKLLAGEAALKVEARTE